MDSDIKLAGQRCQCGACGLYFRSTHAFDKHRAGEYGTGRRCLSEAEMIAKGMAQNDRGVWVGSVWERAMAALPSMRLGRSAEPVDG